MKNKALFRWRWATLLILFGLVFAGLLPHHPPVALAQTCATGSIYRVSIDTGGANSGNGNSDPARISSDGRFIVFESTATNLVANDTNGQSDIFVHDQLNCITSRVSLSNSGLQASDGGSTNPQISSDGRYVVFQSAATNLVTGDTNGIEDIFLRDRQQNTTIRVSVSSAGAQGNDFSINPVLSGDGRYVAFESFANNLIAVDQNGNTDIFLRDLTTNTTTILSVDSSGVGTNNESREPAISADGRLVAFMSFASNLVPNDTLDPDIFVRDWAAGTTTIVSVATGGVQVAGNLAEQGPEISPDGRYVTFVSTAQLDPLDNQVSQLNDIYLHDRATSTTQLISVGTSPSGPVAADGESSGPSVSTDGLSVSFESTATNLVVDDSEGQRDIFVRFLANNTTTRMSQNASGIGGNGTSSRASISTDGRYVAFTSSADNLLGTGNDTGGFIDVFIYDRQAGSGAFFAPANLTATAVSRVQINLNWVDNATSETGFSIERSFNGLDGWTQIATRPANSTSFSNTQLFCAYRFYYRVRSYIDTNSDGVFEMVSAYTNPASAQTYACAPDKLAMFQRQSGQVAQYVDFSSPGPAIIFTSTVPAAALGGNWVMGDWDGDSTKTLGIYANNGVFYFTNSPSGTGSWLDIWIGFQNGRPVVAGRFDPLITTDCVGVVDSFQFPPYGLASALYYTCELVDNTAPTLGVQWLSVVLPDSQGHSGTFQYCAGNFDGDRVDSVAIRRGMFIAWTNRAPAPPEPGQGISLSAYDQAQYIGVPETSSEGLFVCGDWDADASSFDSFGILYHTTGNFYRRQDLAWNSGLWTTQQVGTHLGTAAIAGGSWR